LIQDHSFTCLAFGPALQQRQLMETFREVAQSVQSAWAEAFGRNDWPAIAALYAPETAFYGSTPPLQTDRAGVLSYFTGLPLGYISASYAPPHISPLGPDLFAASGSVIFTVRAHGHDRQHAYRMSQVFQLTPDGWRIVLHHASPQPT